MKLPAVWLALAFIVSIAVEEAFPASPHRWLLAAVLAMALAFLLLRGARFLGSAWVVTLVWHGARSAGWPRAWSAPPSPPTTPRGSWLRDNWTPARLSAGEDGCAATRCACPGACVTNLL